MSRDSEMRAQSTTTCAKARGRSELGERDKAPTWQSQVQGEQRDKARERGPEYTGPPHARCGVHRPAALPSGGLQERQRPHVNELTRELHTQRSQKY